MKIEINKISVFLLMVFITVTAFTACESRGGDVVTSENNSSITSSKDAKQDKEITTLKFEDIDYTAKNYEQYDGTQVKIRGYMSSLSPLDGRFIYLMNIPYQNCPFCQPNTSTIVNTVAVYAKNGKRIDFYDGPIEVTGTVEVGYVQDEFGYAYPFKLIDASYTKLDTAQLSESAKMYGALSQDGIIDEIMLIVPQIYTNAFFETYDDLTLDDVSAVTDEDFDRIIKKITAINKNDYGDLISILTAFQEFNGIVNGNLEAQDYAANATVQMEEEYYNIWDSLYAWLNKFEI